jgi:hypothetical protein
MLHEEFESGSLVRDLADASTEADILPKPRPYLLQNWKDIPRISQMIHIARNLTD